MFNAIKIRPLLRVPIPVLVNIKLDSYVSTSYILFLFFPGFSFAAEFSHGLSLGQMYSFLLELLSSTDNRLTANFRQALVC